MSLQNLATQMAAQGRGPDRTLVHMSPREVHGLQALAMAHGGSLTINPQTGLPEAGFLESILPAVAGFALNAFAPGVGTAVGGLFGLGEAAGTALTVGGIAGLSSGSLEKGIMAGMGAYGGAGLSGSLMNSGTSALTQAGVDAAGGAAALGGDASGIAQKVADTGTLDKLKAGFGAAASTPKDFLQDNKYLLGAAFLPALAGGLGDDGGAQAPTRKKYNMNYVKDPVTGALYDTSGEGVTYGGVGRSTRGMADGGIIDEVAPMAPPGGIATETNAPNTQQVAYDTRTDSQKALDYLMGKPGSTNPMLFTHQGSTGPEMPSDYGTRKGGKYILDALTNSYVWIPDADSGISALDKANQERLAAANRGGGGGDRGEQTGDGYSAPVSPLSSPMSGGFMYGLVDAYGNALGGMLPGGFIAQAIAQGMNPQAVADASAKSAAAQQAALNGYTSGKMFGAPPSSPATFGGAGYGIPVGSGGYGVTGQTGAGSIGNPMGVDPATAQGQQAGAAASAQAAANQAMTDAANAQATANAIAAGGQSYSSNPDGSLSPTGGNSGQSPAGGDVGEGGGYGGYGGDGDCVDPKTHVLLADGSEVQAGSLKVGDVVHTLHEDTFEYGDFEVVYAETIQQPKSIVKFTDGSEITTSLSHKFLLVNREWKRVDELKEGDAIETAPNVNAEGFKVVASLEQIGTGDVVKLTIDQAHTYISDGLVSHNKFARGGSVRPSNFYKNGKFNFHPAQVYANGGIAALAGGGLGSLGGYSDGGQLLKGPGDGVSDSIPAKIAGNQPARLADGEFVVPARIVSEIGNGSTDAGARELYKMMARIQAGRKKTVGKNKVAVNSKSARHLPA